MMIKRLLLALCLMCGFEMGAVADDNFSPGYPFDGASGLLTGANLEDLVTLATFTSTAAYTGNTVRLIDGVTLDTTVGAVGTTNPVIQVKTGGIGIGQIGTGAVGTDEVLDYSLALVDTARGGGLRLHWTPTPTTIVEETIQALNADFGGWKTAHVDVATFNGFTASVAYVSSRLNTYDSAGAFGVINMNVRPDSLSQAVIVQSTFYQSGIAVGSSAGPALGSTQSYLVPLSTNNPNQFEYHWQAFENHPAPVGTGNCSHVQKYLKVHGAY